MREPSVLKPVPISPCVPGERERGGGGGWRCHGGLGGVFRLNGWEHVSEPRASVRSRRPHREYPECTLSPSRLLSADDFIMFMTGLLRAGISCRKSLNPCCSCSRVSSSLWIEFFSLGFFNLNIFSYLCSLFPAFFFSWSSFILLLSFSPLLCFFC